MVPEVERPFVCPSGGKVPLRSPQWPNTYIGNGMNAAVRSPIGVSEGPLYPHPKGGVDET